MSAPPASDGFPQLVARIIDTHPEGISHERLAIETSIWPRDLLRITLGLKQAGLIEHRAGRLFVRKRKKKVAPVKLGFWSRLAAAFRGN